MVDKYSITVTKILNLLAPVYALQNPEDPQGWMGSCKI